MIFDFDSSLGEYPINIHATEIGFDSFNLILTLGSFFTFIFVYFLKVLYVALQSIILSKCNCGPKIKK